MECTCQYGHCSKCCLACMVEEQLTKYLVEKTDREMMELVKEEK